MHLETSSNLYGETVNPYNRALTSGGSSGGEGALLALGGSCLGIGTDVGGSIRSPSANNGVYGFRPTTFRLPTEGWLDTIASVEPITSVIGPMSTSLTGLKTFMRVALGAKPWMREPSLVPFPWREGVEKEKPQMKIAILWDDGVVKPHPPVTRALKEVAEKLRHSEHITIVDWQPYRHDSAWEIIASLYFCDGAADESNRIEASGEPWRPLSKFIIKENPYIKKHTISSLWQWTTKREEYRSKYAEIWNQTASNYEAPLEGSNHEQVEQAYEDLRDMVDIILCPVGPGAALPLDCSRYWGYTSQWNLLDYPAIVFPVTQVDPEIDKVEDGYAPRNKDDEYNYKLYEPEKYRDAPVSLQLVARRFEDEKVMEALEIVKDIAGIPFSEKLQ